MKPLRGRKALIVLTDGKDLKSSHTLTDAIEVAQSADTRVYTIRYATFVPADPTSLLIRSLARPGRGELHRLASETGGIAFQAPHDSPAGIFSQIEEDLRTMYVLGFRLPEGWRDGKPHKLDVKSRRRGVTIRATRRFIAQ